QMDPRFVARRRRVRHAAANDRLDRAAERAGLEERLLEEAEVVDDHVRAGGRQTSDGVDERHLAGAAAREEQPRAWRQVVDDLEERGALVAAASLAAGIGGDRDGWQIARGTSLRGMVHAVRDDADRDSRPVVA